MHRLVEKALREHREEQGEVTGYRLITCRNGEAILTGQASDCDEIAQEVIEDIQAALSNPRAQRMRQRTKSASAQGRHSDAVYP